MRLWDLRGAADRSVRLMQYFLWCNARSCDRMAVFCGVFAPLYLSSCKPHNGGDVFTKPYVSPALSCTHMPTAHGAHACRTLCLRGRCGWGRTGAPRCRPPRSWPPNAWQRTPAWSPRTVSGCAPRLIPFLSGTHELFSHCEDKRVCHARCCRHV